MLDEDIELDDEEEELEEFEEAPEISVNTEKRTDELRKQLEAIPTKGANFYMANSFYYEARDYEAAIKMYKAAIAEESDELIVAKSLYYMAESYVKLKELDDAIAVFEDLAKRLPDHYLASSAKRRIAALKEEMEITSNFGGGLENG
ncbi:TPA: tetratricopeptide repeat protein [Candidatus Poribacteria bacterium]|nr:tetratricopeptide repeat protein [Candidatus Poribacteria bacterium]